MTPPELLEELKQVDPETYEALRNYEDRRRKPSGLLALG